MGNELRAIVHPQMGRRWIQLEEILNRVDHVNSLAPAAYPNSQTDAAVFINHVQELEPAPVLRWVPFIGQSWPLTSLTQGGRNGFRYN